MSITNIRQPNFSDITHLVDIDLKCFEDNMELKEWRMTFEDDDIFKLVGTVERTPVGFVLWRVVGNVLTVTRVGVKPAYRHRSIGKQLIDAVRIWASVHKIYTLNLEVPESLCDPRYPSLDIGGWLQKLGFRADRIEKGKAIFCGQAEDAFVFSKTWTVGE